MSWRLAGSLERLREQVDEAAPGRSKVSDGSIGDPSHAARTSDHNPHCGYPEDPTVTAIDITDDPDSGAGMKQVAEALRESRDPRIKYVIFQGRMFSCYPTSSTPAWVWRPYSGINAHAHHMHISVNCDGGKDSRKDWDIGREWDEMATKEEVEQVVRKVVREELKDARVELAVGKDQKGYDSTKVNLKAIWKEVQK